MKKIFILTGEPSGDKLASTVISKLKSQNPDIEYSSVGGNHLKKLGIESIFNLNEITYLGFTSILFNIFKIRNKINHTVNEIIKFNPDILFSVDSPDFTMRVAERVKKINTNIKTIHYVAPQVWIWRKNRVKKIKKFIDHILLLFDFEKKYFDEENINNTFVGHPLIENNEDNKKIIENIIPKNKKIISIFPGSRKSETDSLLNILIDFIKLMNKRHNDFYFYFHATDENKNLILSKIKKLNIENVDVVSDENIKDQFPNSFLYSKPNEFIPNIWSAIGATGPPTYENTGHNNNLSFITSNEGVVVINAGASSSLAKALHDEIKKITNKLLLLP